MMLEYKTLQKNEMSLAKKLWATCFEEDSQEFINYYFANCVEDGSFIGAFFNGKLISMLQIKEYNQEYHGSSVKTGYLVGVCTEPAYRMQGYSKKLIYMALDTLKCKGIAFSGLYPFNYLFYEKFGYAVCNEKQIISIDKDQFSRFDTKSIEISIIDRINSEINTAELLKCYNGFISRFSGYIIRDEALMRINLQRHLINEKAGVLIAKENGMVVGYALFTRTDKGIIADEVVYTDKIVLAAIANRLRDDKYAVKLTVPSSDKINLYMDDPIDNVRCEPHTMGLLLDITKSFIISELEGLNERINIKITNNPVGENIEIYEISEHGIKKVIDVNYDIECDIATYSQLLWGYIGCEFAARDGLLKVNNYELLPAFESVIQEKSTYVFEMF